MKSGLLFLMILMALSAVSQSNMAMGTNSKFIGESGGLYYFELKDEKGELIKFSSEMGIEGSPLLLNQWSFGRIRFLNGHTFADSAMNLSLYNHRFYIKRNDSYLEIIQPIEAVIISDKEKPVGNEDRIFKNGFPVIDYQDKASLYEVLFQ